MTHKETQNFTRVNVSTERYAEVKATWHEVKEQKEGRGKREGIGTFYKFREYLENLESLCVPLRHSEHPFIPLYFLHLSSC